MTVQSRKIFFLIFSLSGFSELINESIWSHYLKLFLGHAAYAQTLVLAIFMRQCYSNLSQQEKKWIFLLKSTSNRDPKKMAESSKILLEDSGEIPLGAKKYLIASGMLGALSQKDYSGSYRLWLKHKSSVFGNKEPDLLFRLLAAESATGS